MLLCASQLEKGWCLTPMEKPVLAVFGPDQPVCEYLSACIQEYIGNLVEITRYSADRSYAFPQTADLVVSSGVYTYPMAKALFPGCKVIAAERIVAPTNLEELLRLPRGTRVLLVNHPKSISEATIRSLQSFGINHVIYEPFWLEKRNFPDRIDVIVTPGVPQWCPRELNVPIIDIGPRQISISTMAEILQFFGFSTTYLHISEQEYIRQYVSTSQNLHFSLEHSELLLQWQKAILHELDTGILALDKQGAVVISNPAMEHLFQAPLEKNQELFSVLEQLDSTFPEADREDGYSRSETLQLQRKGLQLSCRKNEFHFGDEPFAFYTFKRLTNVPARKRQSGRHNAFTARYHFADILGESEHMRLLKMRAERFAKTDETILITGESGTGKELFAQAIHNASARASGPFVAINLAAIAHSLLESELFGYQEGAFTGAAKGGKLGYFELANGGTIFLDEIGDTPLHIQVMLLRVLEMREIVRVGGEESIPIDVRVIAATNISLEDAIRRQQFRQDFFYRLNVLSLQTIPLREMQDELPEIARRYLTERFHDKVQLSPDAVALLQQHTWAGNFRELHNVMTYAHYAADGRDMITAADFPAYLSQHAPDALPRDVLASSPYAFDVLSVFVENAPAPVGRRSVVADLERRGCHVSEALCKRILSDLVRMGFLQAGTTRQGTSITEKGLRAWNDMVRDLDADSDQSI